MSIILLHQNDFLWEKWPVCSQLRTVMIALFCKAAVTLGYIIKYSVTSHFITHNIKRHVFKSQDLIKLRFSDLSRTLSKLAFPNGYIVVKSMWSVASGIWCCCFVLMVKCLYHTHHCSCTTSANLKTGKWAKTFYFENRNLIFPKLGLWKMLDFISLVCF